MTTNYILSPQYGNFSIHGNLADFGSDEGDILLESGGDIVLDEIYELKDHDRSANNETIAIQSARYIDLSDVSPLTLIKRNNPNTFGWGDF